MPFLLALVPSAGVLFIFYLAIRALLEADRRERVALARLERAERAATASVQTPEPPQAPPTPAAGTSIPERDDPARRAS